MSKNKVLRACRGLSLILAVFCLFGAARAEDGYDLWLRYPAMERGEARPYKAAVKQIVVADDAGETVALAVAELERGLDGLLGAAPAVRAEAKRAGNLWLVSGGSRLPPGAGVDMDALGSEGYAMRSVDGGTVIAANSDIGVLYGVFHFLRLMQTRESVDGLD
ncbi:MAG: hypothetical protein KAH44_21805, partial [Oricola sp.]|nr:hypothetical protein [Oricola sp.]